MANKIVLTSGLALFAMFFGAGNIIYPLALGAQAGNHIPYVLITFMISGIGLPFLGLFATSLYQGDYWKFFQPLGKIPSFLVITFLILIIGPLFAIPRTETVMYHTIQPFLVGHFEHPYLISAAYCLILFALTYSHTKVIDIIGRVLSPIKLSLFTILIVMGLLGTHTIAVNPNTIYSSIKLGLIDGYSTMDLLATFFFCAVVCKNISLKAKLCGIHDNKTVIKLFLLSCLVGGTILGFVYIGFMLVALCHASALQGVDTAQMIYAVSQVVLGQFGTFFVCICVSFACLVTAIALTEVTCSFIYEYVLRKKIHRTICLVGIIITIFTMSILGFTEIMKIALPILEFLYPALIFYCLFSIGRKVLESRRLSREVISMSPSKAAL